VPEPPVELSADLTLVEVRVPGADPDPGDLHDLVTHAQREPESLVAGQPAEGVSLHRSRLWVRVGRGHVVNPKGTR
jgi:hypothetical protein